MRTRNMEDDGSEARDMDGIAYDWPHPLALTHHVTQSLAPDAPYILLYSGMSAKNTGRYSYLAYDLADSIIAEDFAPLEVALEVAEAHEIWFGYLGYGLKNTLESLQRDAPSPIDLPNLWMARFNMVLRFDHEAKTVEALAGVMPALPPHFSHPAPVTAPLQRKTQHSTMDKTSYCAIIDDTLAAIHRGDLYEANITRKCFGTLKQNANILETFIALIHASPAPYSALLKLNTDTAILSSSPESFIAIDAARTVTSRPVKGTIARGNNAQDDAAHIAALHNSEKDRAENLMIVDLVRNDLARVCKAGSVKVSGNRETESYATLHHLVSTVTGVLRDDCATLDAIKATFPAGSMTGAPKIAAMEWCSKKEPRARGVYSGAIGWLRGSGELDLSVIIRTLILQGDTYEYQTGGAIVADSDPVKEWEELQLKARHIEGLFV